MRRVKLPNRQRLQKRRSTIISITVEKAKPEDAEAIVDLLRKTWLDTYPNQEAGITEADIRIRTDGKNGDHLQNNINKWRQKIESADHKSMFYVVRDNAKVVGFTHPVITTENQHRIGALYVLPEAQGRGVGSQLIQANLSWHGNNAPIYLAVAAYNKKAIEFYKQFGFIETGEKVEDLSARKRGLKEIPEIEMMRPAN